MKLGRVISSEIGLNRDGEKDVLLLQVEISDPDDIQTVEYLQAAGVDYRPPPGTSVIVVGLGSAWQIAIAADDGIEPEAEEGEHQIYASENGAKKGKLTCKKDGTVRAGAGDDFVGQAGKIDQIIADIMSVFSNWTPAPNDGGAALKAAWSAQFTPPPGSVASSNFKADD